MMSFLVGIFGAFFPVIFVIVFVIITGIHNARKRAKQNKSVYQPPLPLQTQTSDGHTLPKSKDVTCETEYGHDHGPQAARYIVHDDPEKGYVVLNGVKRRLEDCKYL